MLFNSYIFIFVFLPICLLGFYGLLHSGKPGAARVFLTAMSLWFYGYFNRNYLLIMVCSIAVNFLFHRLLSREDLWRRAVLILAVGFNLGLLFYFKYFDFFLTIANGLFGTEFVLRGILLPLGISFFTFQQISFLVDTYRGEVKDCPFTEYALFVSFFPQLIAGPIVNHSEMLPQFRAFGEKKADWEQIAGGVLLFVLGLAKKVLLADTFGAGADFGYADPAALGRADAALVILFYALQLYFDFSGYCDMARGLGKMFGIEIPVNFDSPYKAVNIVDFWKRWHITLNRFFTKYVYIPLGGNRRGRARMYCNLLLVFFLSGLWHGAGWNFIVWGMLHGVLYVATRFLQSRGRQKSDTDVKNDKGVGKDSAKAPDASGDVTGFGSRIGKAVSQILTFLYVSVAWVYFRAADIAQANAILRTALAGKVQKISDGLAECFRVDEFWYALKVLHLDNFSFSRSILMWAILIAGLYLAMVGRNAAERASRVRFGPVSAAACVILAVWCILSLSGVSTFLYFNF
ncbi:MAG: hypothetical protein NC302_02615 [Bacteroidales bacterium]|nr:hypothetical protein [Bacteroidales bacterium]MCM1416560.1 MBOAT family protein [bacterium]MCM1423100.1 MBOAT family protein [bacterium]